MWALRRVQIFVESSEGIDTKRERRVTLPVRTGFTRWGGRGRGIGNLVCVVDCLPLFKDPGNRKGQLAVLYPPTNDDDDDGGQRGVVGICTRWKNW